MAILTLAFGIGLNTAMFSFLNTLLLRPLPFPDAESLVRLYRSTPENQYGALSPADYFALPDQEEAGFGRFAGYQTVERDALRAGPGHAMASRVRRSLRRARCRLRSFGRSFRPDEEIAGNHRIVIISHALWRDRFASRAGRHRP